jgi:hypothetical protein
MVVPIVLALCAGTGACIAAFVMRKFLLLFITAGAIWIEFLFYLYLRWWPGIPFVPFQRKWYRGIAVLFGLLVFAGTWYVIVWLDRSLK